MVATFQKIAYLPNYIESFSPLFIGAMVATTYPRSTKIAYTFSPLFIGAMVATTGPIPFRKRRTPFSPLFIGAMVATQPTERDGHLPSLSVPFSSGQWLLLLADTVRNLCKKLSVPFSSGQWLLQCLEHCQDPERLLSVPFSSGQWLLQRENNAVNGCLDTFSPLFIGAMVATNTLPPCRTSPVHFQSPFHRGNGCYMLAPPRSCRSTRTFSPLFIGAMVATTGEQRR